MVERFDLSVDRISKLLSRFAFSLGLAGQLAHGVGICEAVKRAHVALPGSPVGVPTALERVNVLSCLKIDPWQKEVQFHGALVPVANPHAGPGIGRFTCKGKFFERIHDLFLHVWRGAFIGAEVDHTGGVSPFAPIAVDELGYHVDVTPDQLRVHRACVAFVVNIREQIVDRAGGVRDACVEDVDDHNLTVSSWR